MVNQMVKNRYKNALFIFLEIISFSVSFVILIKNSGEYSYFIVLLPAFNFIILILYQFFTRDTNLMIGSAIIHGSYFVRFTLTPLFMVLGNYFVINGKTLNYDVAIVFMIYEYLLVTFTMCLFRKKNTYVSNVNNNTYTFKSKVKIIIIILTLLSLLFVLKYPAILSIFRFGFLSDNELIIWQKNFNLALKTVPIIPYYLVSWTLVLLKYIYVFFALLLIKKLNIRFKIFFSLLLIFFTSFISTGTTSDSLYFSLIYFFILMDFYPKNYKAFIVSLIIIVISFLFGGLFFFIIKRSNHLGFSYTISKILLAYFGGITNVASSLEITEYNVFEIIKGDFLRSLPLIKGFFTTLTRSDTVFNNYIGDSYESQIIPSLGQSYLYFGKVLSPAIAVIFTYLTLKSENKIYSEDRIEHRFLLYLLIIRFACIPVLYNLHIFFIGFFNSYVPLYVLFLLNKKGVDD